MVLVGDRRRGRCETGPEFACRSCRGPRSSREFWPILGPFRGRLSRAQCLRFSTTAHAQYPAAPIFYSDECIGSAFDPPNNGRPHSTKYRRRPHPCNFRPHLYYDNQSAVTYRVRNRWLASFELTNHNIRMCNAILDVVF